MALEIGDGGWIGMDGVERSYRIVRTAILQAALSMVVNHLRCDRHYALRRRPIGSIRFVRRAASIPAAPSAQWLPLLAMSDIFAMASSMVNVLGFWIAGKSLKVSANFPAAACASMMK